MVNYRQSLLQAGVAFLLFSVLCGIVYPAVVTGLSYAFSPPAAVFRTADNTHYSAALGQPFRQAGHLWGRPVLADVTAHTAADGTPLYYAGPSNLSPAGSEFASVVAERVAYLRAHHPERAAEPVPVDLVTASGSGLDPHISPAAAEYQVLRLAHETGRSPEAVRAIIRHCTEPRFLGIFGEETVQVTRVNLILDGLLAPES